MSDGGDTAARELGLVIIVLGCLLTIVTSTFGAVWAFYGIGWACRVRAFLERAPTRDSGEYDRQIVSGNGELDELGVRRSSE